MIRSRSLSAVAGMAVALAGTLAWASPVSAQYDNDPLTRDWRADGSVHSSVSSGSRIFVGGQFDGGGGIAALNANTGALLWEVQTDGDVRALAVSEDGSTLYAGGGFTVANGFTRRHLVALDVTDGSIAPRWRPSAGGMVRDLLVDGDTLYVAGTFAKMAGAANRGIGALIASTGKRDTSFDHFVDKKAYGLALTSTSVIVTGTFTLVDNQPRQSIASFNRSTHALTSWAPYRLCSGCNSYWDVAVDGTNAYVATSGPGGNFGAFNLVTGAQPYHYVHADGDVQSLGWGADGLMYIGGHFGQFVGNRNNVRTVMAAINPKTGAVDPNFHPKFYDTWPGMWTIATTNGVLWGGGAFAGVGKGPNQSNNHVPYLAAFGAQ